MTVGREATTEWHTTACLIGSRPCRCEQIKRHNLFRSAWSRKDKS